jgi:hypothetical protein
VSPSRRATLLVVAVLLLVALVPAARLLGERGAGHRTDARPGPSRARDVAASTSLPPVRHVFVINLENKGFDATWGPGSRAPYLSRTLRARGVLLRSYYGTAHRSQANYVAQISGQGPDPQMQSDCRVYSAFVRTGTAAPGQAVGSGCVFPASVPTLPGQLTSRGLTWKGYLEDSGTPCRHPVLGAVDHTQQARVGDQYAVRHNPFVYFRSITGSADCAKRVVPLSRLTGDLRARSTTPNLVYVTPNLCDDGHDAPCVDGRPGGLVSADRWLARWVPRILASPAFRADGVLVVTADESDSARSDARACCGEVAGPNAASPGIRGPGGGRTGALVVSRWTRPGTSSTRPYDHYSLLASVEDLFGLPHLGYARTPGLDRFAGDVWSRWAG